MEEQKIIHTSSIKLSKSVKGEYGWEIRVANDDLKKVVNEIKEIDEMMKKEFKINLEEDKK